MDFKDKNILIIGGSSGIGHQLISELSILNATLYTASRNKAEDWPKQVNYLPFDVLENKDKLSDFLPDQLHGLVYAVGSITLKPFSRVTEVDLLKDYQLNVVGAAMVIQQALKSLKLAENASVVLISSVAATTGMSFHTSIATAKAALEGFAISLAAELASSQIRVNVIAPSLTNTPLAASLLSSDEKRAASAKRHPLGRFGEPTDCSAAIRFLLSDESSWITGQILGVDGGMGSLRTNF
ncbi:MAG: SDR family oxidoreductase [Pedobacter sp.]|nr:SDR family oxidoreductase [Pedobacter sp.]